MVSPRAFTYLIIFPDFALPTVHCTRYEIRAADNKQLGAYIMW